MSLLKGILRKLSYLSDWKVRPGKTFDFQSCPLDVRSPARRGIASTKTLTRWAYIRRRAIALYRIPDKQQESSEPS